MKLKKKFRFEDNKIIKLFKSSQSNFWKLNYIVIM